jgi:acetyl-CoA carboxylase biotin carboxyl carrier protein
MAEGKEMKELRELVEFLKASGIAEFEMERPDLKVGLKFAGAAAAAVPAVPAPMAAAVAAPAPAAAPAAAADPYAGMHVVKSPIVGTFYAAPSPDAEPFVKVGDEVSVGKVLCIVEAMKLMNEIESDAAGRIEKVFAKPGQPVEYGQPLFAVK